LGEMKRFAGESPINDRDLSTVPLAGCAERTARKRHSKWVQAPPAAPRAVAVLDRFIGRSVAVADRAAARNGARRGKRGVEFIDE